MRRIGQDRLRRRTQGFTPLNSTLLETAPSLLRSKVNEVWSKGAEQRAQEQGWYWMAHPMVLARVNRLISGDPGCDAYGRLERLYRERRWALPVRRAVSLGCGFGNLERDLAKRGWVERIAAYDLAEGAVAQARRLADEAGLSGITYAVADLNTLRLDPGSADAVFAHSAVHHVQDLEHLYFTVRAALRPRGVFHLNEFVGPTRFQWTDAQLRLVNDFLDALPPRLRRVPDGSLKGAMRRPGIDEMIAADPTEAVRSADLVAALDPFFKVVEERRTGGALLHLALGDIAQNFDPESAEDRAILLELFALEDRAMADGTIGSDFAVVTAVPRRWRRRVPRPGPASGGAPLIGPAAPRSPLTRVSLSLPPVRRLYDALRRVDAASQAMRAEQDRLARDLARVSGELAWMQAAAQQALAQASAAQQRPAPAPEGGAGSEIDRLTAREMQSAALRHLPFLPGEIRIDADGIQMEGHAGAPEGLTANMAFFVNGRRFDRVEYPVLDPELAGRFSEVCGMGNIVRAVITEHLDELRQARFWRFDASPTGRYVAAHWRKAVHFMNPAFERAPMPPEPNIQRVIGDTSVARFAMGGATIFKNIEAYLAELGHGWADFPRILDWGCGAGRVTRYMLSETGCRVTGADIDPDNIAWCRQAYPDGRFEQVPLRPPTAFEDGAFDLVTGLSVMTHLQERDQWLWLGELRRVVRPGGLAFLSVKGPTQFAYNRFPPHLYRLIQDRGYLDLWRDGALDGVIGDPEYYRAAMHSRAYITERWSRYFEVVAIIDAIAGLQDFVVLRRR
jgi:SAM-dependent methyltransferase